MNAPIRLLLVDSQAMFREGLKCLFSTHNRFTVVAEASSAKEAVDAFARTQPDIVLTDLMFSGRGGISLVSDLATLGNPLKLAILATQRDDIFVDLALRAGAVGYFLKSEPFAELHTGLLKISEDEPTYASKIIPRLTAICLTQATKQGIGSLSAREMEVFHLFGEGHSTGEIADKLGLSPKTVDSYCEHLYLKLGIRGRNNLVRMAREIGISESKIACAPACAVVSAA
jgi:DNA-binding NarL/FixJ family response regulator